MGNVIQTMFCLLPAMTFKTMVESFLPNTESKRGLLSYKEERKWLFVLHLDKRNSGGGECPVFEGHCMLHGNSSSRCLRVRQSKRTNPLAIRDIQQWNHWEETCPRVGEIEENILLKERVWELRTVYLMLSTVTALAMFFFSNNKRLLLSPTSSWSRKQSILLEFPKRVSFLSPFPSTHRI